MDKFLSYLKSKNEPCQVRIFPGLTKEIFNRIYCYTKPEPREITEKLLHNPTPEEFLIVYMSKDWDFCAFLETEFPEIFME